MLKISIITPCWNAAQFIEQTIQSILAQRGNFELEYIIVDGLSTDGTVDIIKKYESQLKWISERDNGQTSAINKGLSMATGDVVAFLNADDLYKANTLEQVAQKFSDPKVQWLVGLCDIIDINNNEVRQAITAYKNYSLRRASHSRILAENFISQPAVFWRRELMNKAGLLDESEHYVMDYEYWLRLWQFHPPTIHNDYLASFRWYETSKSGSGFSTQFADELRVACKYASPYSWPIMLHRFNYMKIVTAYTLMAWWRKVRG